MTTVFTHILSLREQKEDHQAEEIINLSQYILQAINLFAFYNLPFISMINYIRKNSNKIGIEHFSIFLYFSYLIITLIVCTLIILTLPFDPCKTKSIFFCQKILTSVILNILKCVLAITILILAKNLPKSEIFQMMSTASLSQLDYQDSLNYRLNLDFDDHNFLLDDQNVQFSVTIDPKQKIDKNGLFSHEIQLIEKKIRMSEVQSKIGSLNINKDMFCESFHRSERKPKGSRFKKRKSIETKMIFYKSEKQLETLFFDIKKIKGVFMLQLDQFELGELDVTELENDINLFLNKSKSSSKQEMIQNERIKEKIKDFFNLEKQATSGKTWMKNISLYIEFPSAFYLSNKMKNLLFRSFQVLNFEYTNKMNVFNIIIQNVQNFKTFSLTKTLEDIEHLIRSLFSSIVFPKKINHHNFKREVIYLINVSLNESEELNTVQSFLKMNVCALQSTLINTCFLEIDLKLFGRSDKHSDFYQIVLTDTRFLSGTKEQITRGKKHFRILSNNLAMRFGVEYLFRFEKFLDVKYVYEWLVKLQSNDRIAKSVEFILFLNYFKIN